MRASRPGGGGGGGGKLIDLFQVFCNSIAQVTRSCAQSGGVGFAFRVGVFRSFVRFGTLETDE